MTDTMPGRVVKRGRLPVSAAVLWTGLATGTFLAVEALTHRVMVPGLGGYAGAVVTFVLLLAAGVLLAELVRRHHRAAARHGWRHGKRGASAAYRGARRHGGRGAAFVATQARSRWASGWFQWREPLEIPAEADPQSGNSTKGTTMTDTPGNVPPSPSYGPFGRPRYEGTRQAPRRTAANGAVPGAWGAVVAHTTDFQAESDGDLLNWMRGEAMGAAAYAEALVEQYETCRDVIGVDPVAIQTLHDVADAATTMAATMAAAIKKFAEHYELPTQFVSDGGLLAHDGRWHRADAD